MPFVLLFIGIALIVSAIQGTLSQLGTLVRNDLTGKGNFLYWLVAMLIIGSIGYVNSLKRVSDTFMALLIIVIILANDKGGAGFFAKLTQAINGSQDITPTTASAAVSNNPQVEAPSSSSSSSGGSGGSGGGLVSTAETLAPLALAFA